MIGNGEENALAARIARLPKEQREMLARVLLDLGEVPHRQPVEPIAIVGMACRFPGAGNLEAFWELLREGPDATREVPPERAEANRWFDPDLADPEKGNSRWGGFLEDIDCFDPRFFGLSFSEAEAMDPQQRLVLQVAWETLENAGMPPATLAGRATGVYVGVCNWDYERLSSGAPRRGATGVALSMTANRLSYFLDARGPSMVVDTACSSSLVSVDLACQSLRNGAADLALAGGVNVILSPRLMVSFSQAGMMASDGRCKTFDDRADGYVRGEGCGMVALKRLSDARRAGNRIYATLAGSAVNHNGKSNGLTAPHPGAQRDAISRALGQAGVGPEQIDYVEAHGSGTPLGDVIEVQALASILSSNSEIRKKGACLLGSVKTNIGHLEAAAGIAGLIKTALALHHRQIPAHLHLERLNPRLGKAMAGFEAPTVTKPWPGRSGSRFAGVSSFGFGGANVHAILGEAPSQSLRASTQKPLLNLFTLSARTGKALRDYVEKYVTWLTRHPQANLADLCFTAYRGRSHFPHRLALLVKEVDDLTMGLRAFLGGENSLKVGAASSLGRSNLPRLFTSPQKLPKIERLRGTPEPSGGGHAGESEEASWVTAAQLYVGGADPKDMNGALWVGRTIDLPTYPFAREKCWREDIEGCLNEVRHRTDQPVCGPILAEHR